MSELDEAGALLAELGVEVAPLKVGSHSPREERIIAGFEDILRFHQQQGRAPLHGEGRDIFERLYAVRLDQLRKLPEALILLTPLDTYGLLKDGPAAASADQLDGDALLAELGVDAAQAVDDIRILRHVRSHADIKAAEEIADRAPCEDFEKFRPRFEEVELGLKEKTWTTREFRRDASIEVGDFFIVGGQIAYVAEILAGTRTKDGRDNPRLRVVFDNQTESNLLLRSLSRSLYPDGDVPVGRRLTRKDAGPLFGSEAEAHDIESGTIYVLQSLSSHPFLVEHRELIHKIGVTGGKVETRIAGAALDPTYLLADVKVVATYKLSNINRTKLENIFHRIFAPARLDLTVPSGFGHDTKPKEWFVVPIHVINEAVERIRDGSIVNMVYDPATACLIHQ